MIKLWTDIGYENEFFDQAHFIKDFKDFTGISPKEFYTNKNFTLSSLLYARIELLHCYNSHRWSQICLHTTWVIGKKILGIANCRE